MQHLILFSQDFLKKEYSEENVEFWKVCEDYRNIIDSNFVSLASLQENLSLRFPTRSDTNRAVQPQKMARGLKFRKYKDCTIYEVHALISCAVTAQLIYAFVFAYTKLKFLHDVFFPYCI